MEGLSSEGRVREGCITGTTHLIISSLALLPGCNVDIHISYPLYILTLF